MRRKAGEGYLQWSKNPLALAMGSVKEGVRRARRSKSWLRVYEFKRWANFGDEGIDARSV